MSVSTLGINHTSVIPVVHNSRITTYILAVVPFRIPNPSPITSVCFSTTPDTDPRMQHTFCQFNLICSSHCRPNKAALFVHHLIFILYIYHVFFQPNPLSGSHTSSGLYPPVQARGKWLRSFLYKLSGSSDTSAAVSSCISNVVPSMHTGTLMPLLFSVSTGACCTP